MYKRGTWVSFLICRIEIPFIYFLRSLLIKSSNDCVKDIVKIIFWFIRLVDVITVAILQIYMCIFDIDLYLSERRTTLSFWHSTRFLCPLNCIHPMYSS